jgi:hypothetical protein
LLRHSLFPACLGDLIPNSRALFSWSLGKVLCLWFSPFSLPRSSLWPFCCSVTLAPVLHLIESKTTLSPSCGPLGCGLLSQPELGGVSGPPSPVSSAPRLCHLPSASVSAACFLQPARPPEPALLRAGRRAAGLGDPDKGVGFRAGPPSLSTVQSQPPACRSRLDSILFIITYELK